jgi:pseudaminic acid cytidylyltransferase
LLNSIAIITARGGSKRIPKKNIKLFAGKPIIQYSIEAAKESMCFDEVMVSTDDIEIAELALSLGATVPFMRSPSTSDDFSTTSEVLEEVLLKYKSIGKEFKYFCCLYPTAPLISANVLQSAYKKLIDSGADSVIPVVKYSSSIYRSFRTENGYLKMNWPENLNIRSQDLPASFYDSGQFYFVKSNYFNKNRKIFGDFTLPFELSFLESQDIDSYSDWEIAEFKFELKNRHSKS